MASHSLSADDASFADNTGDRESERERKGSVGKGLPLERGKKGCRLRKERRVSMAIPVIKKQPEMSYPGCRQCRRATYSVDGSHIRRQYSE